MWRKNKSFIESASCALKGLIYAIKTERQFRSYFFIIVSTLIIKLIVHEDYIGYITWFLGITGVFASECLNTAIEHLADRVTKEFDTDIGITKDLAAGSLLCWGIYFFVNEVIQICRVFV